MEYYYEGVVEPVIEKTKNLINYLKEEINNKKIKPDIDSLISKLERITKKISKDHAYILICGLAKSGKSTLVNCLVKPEDKHLIVSPMKRGRECTIVPSVISSGKENNIHYYEKQIDQDSFKKNFENLLDEYKGIQIHQDLPQENTENSGIITTDKILQLSASEDSKSNVEDIAFIEVKTKENSILSKHGISIIDSPGIDGNISGMGKNPLQKWLQDEADIVIIVHSTLAAITEKLSEYLKYFKSSGRNETPFILFYNEFDTKPWRKELKTKFKESDYDENDEAENFLKKNGIITKSTFRCNLGKAYDALLLEDDDNKYPSLSEPRMDDFESKISEYIKKNKRKLIEENNVKSIENILKNSKEELNENLLKFKEEEKKRDEIIKEFEEIDYKINHIPKYYKNNFENMIEKNLITTKPMDKEQENSVIKITLDLIDNIKKYRDNPENYPENAKQKIINIIPIITKKLLLFKDVEKFYKDLKKNIEDFCKKTIKEKNIDYEIKEFINNSKDIENKDKIAIDSIDKLIEEIKKEFEIKIIKQNYEIKNVDFIPDFKIINFNTKPNHSKAYRSKTLKNDIDDMLSGFKKDIQFSLEKYKDEICYSFENKFKKERQEKIKKILEEIKDEFNENTKKTNETNKKAINEIAKVINRLNLLNSAEISIFNNAVHSSKDRENVKIQGN